MTRPQTKPRPAPENSPAPVCYVYGVVPARAYVPEKLAGVHGGEVTLVPYRDIAAVVSEISPDRALGTSDDLSAYEHVVAAFAEETTMLPLKFGAVVAGPDALVEEMLGPFHGWFADGLASFAGRREFVLIGTYVEPTVLREIIMEDEEIMRLRERLRDLPEEVDHDERIRMGELVAHALDDKLVTDTEFLLDKLAPYAVGLVKGMAAGEESTVKVAFLVPDENRGKFEHAVDMLGERWVDRVRLRLVGPLAAYDFVPPGPEEV